MLLAINEDGSLPGEPISFLEGFIWFFVTPMAIFALVWVLVVASESVKNSRKNRVKQDVITRINE